MCRGADLGVCCELGCDERIQCQDTGGYCPEHDPHCWEEPTTNVADDPAKRRAYTLGRLTQAIPRLEASIDADRARLADYQARVRALEAAGS